MICKDYQRHFTDAEVREIEQLRREMREKLTATDADYARVCERTHTAAALRARAAS